MSYSNQRIHEFFNAKRAYQHNNIFLEERGAYLKKYPDAYNLEQMDYLLSLKLDKVINATLNNFATLLSNGGLKDSDQTFPLEITGFLDFGEF